MTTVFAFLFVIAVLIVVHELAHMKQRAHDKAFYQLCTHMEPDYHQFEFDFRLYLTQLDIAAEVVQATG